MSRAQCYDINGDVDESSYPCNSADGATAAQCCHANDTCMSNGLCYPPIDLGLLTPYFVFGCTDPDWRAEECLDTCLRIPDGGDGIADCGAGYYCCFGLGGCECNDTDATSVFSLAVTRAVATIPPQSEWLAAASSTSVTTSSGGVVATGVTTATSLPPTTGASLVEATPTPTETAQETGSSSNSSTIALGAGLGAGLGAAAVGLAGLGFWLMKRRKQRRTVERPSDDYKASESAPIAQYPAEMVGSGTIRSKQQSRQELDGHMALNGSNASPVELPSQPFLR